MSQRLKLFGGIGIETDDGPLTGRAVQRRRLALLALLGVARSRGMSRDRLIAYLWPEADGENGRRFLSDSVYRINQALGGDVILAAGDELRLDPERLPSDLAVFEDALASGDQEAAVRAYTGPFLDGFFLSASVELERWIETERAHRAREYARAVESLAECAERDGSVESAAEWWRRLAALDPYNSRTAIRLMRALDATGERAAAIQHARVHETLLREDLAIEPPAEVRALAEELRRGGGRSTASKAQAEASPAQERRPSSGGSRAEHETSSLADAASESGGVADATDAVTIARGRRRFRAATLVATLVTLIVLVVVPIVVVRLNERAGAYSLADSARTVAVLPFANLSGAADEYFVDGITEELIGTLGRVPGIRVASRTSVFAWKNRPADVREVGRRLGAGSVVEGSVRKSGNKLRITARLVSATNGYEIWSESYEREAPDAFAVQEEIARAVALKIRGTLAGIDTTRRDVAAATQDPEAYDLYLRGRFAWHKRTREGLTEAVDYFGRAVVRAPTYALAYVGLADAHAVKAFYDYERPRAAYPAAEAAARRAIAIDPTLAPPHATLGYVFTYYQLDWPRAEAEFQHAIEMDPGYSVAHQWYANLLTVAGRFGEAEREFRASQEADPLSLIARTALGWSFHFAGRDQEAYTQCGRALALGPDFVLAHLWGGIALEELGRTREALEWIGRADSLANGSALTRLALAHALARSGMRAGTDSARAIVRVMEARRERGEYLPAYEIAKVHLALGEKERALAWLRTTLDDRSHSRAYLAIDPQLAPLRGSEAFEAIVGRRRD